MNHNYQKVVELAQELDIDESYIGKALKDYGYNEFPKSGLEDIGATKLLYKAIDIAHAEAMLIQRKHKKEYLPVPKVKEEKAVSLEEKVGKTTPSALENSIKIFTYPTIGVTFALPTMCSKWNKRLKLDGGEKSWNLFPIIEGFAISFVAYKEMPPKLIPYIAGVQIATNAISLGYECYKHVKNKTRKNRSNLTENQIASRERCYKKNDCKSCNDSECVYFRGLTN